MIFHSPFMNGCTHNTAVFWSAKYRTDTSMVLFIFTPIFDQDFLKIRGGAVMGAKSDTKFSKSFFERSKIDFYVNVIY